MTQRTEEAKAVNAEGLGQQDPRSASNGEEGDDVAHADSIQHDVACAGGIAEESHGEFGDQEPHKMLVDFKSWIVEVDREVGL